MKTYLFTF